MDSLTTAELIDIALRLREDAQTQFEYWLTITFAVIGAAFFGKQHLNNQVRVAVSALYLLATLLLVLRYLEVVSTTYSYMLLIEQREAFLTGTSAVTTLIRFAVFALGSAAAIWFLYSGRHNSDAET